MSTNQPTNQQTPTQMSTIQDTDLLLVNRAGVDYKCTAADVKAYGSAGGGNDVDRYTVTMTGTEKKLDIQMNREYKRVVIDLCDLNSSTHQRHKLTMEVNGTSNWLVGNNTGATVLWSNVIESIGANVVQGQLEITKAPSGKMLMFGRFYGWQSFNTPNHMAQQFTAQGNGASTFSKLTVTLGAGASQGTVDYQLEPGAVAYVTGYV